MDDNRKYGCLAGEVATKLPSEESREQGLGPTDPEQESGLFPPPGSLENGTVTEKRSEGSIKEFFTVKFERTKSCSLKSLRKSLLGNQCIQL